jgi:hypothetical protein
MIITKKFKKPATEFVIEQYCCPELFQNLGVFIFKSDNDGAIQICRDRSIIYYSGNFRLFSNINYCPYCGEKFEIKDLTNV